MTSTNDSGGDDALFRRLRLGALVMFVVVLAVPRSLLSEAALALVVLALAAMLSSDGGRRLLMLPGTQLGLLGMVFFGVLPAALAPWILAADPQYADYTAKWDDHWARPLLVGVLAGLLVGTLYRSQSDRRDLSSGDPLLAGLGAGLALTVAGLQVLRLPVPFSALLPLLAAFGLILTAFLMPMAKRWRSLVVLMAVVVPTLAAGILADLGKQPVFTLVVLAGIVVVRWRVRLLAVLATGGAVSVLAIVMVTLTLPPHPVQGSGLARLGHEIATAIHYKVWVRQMQTVACFASVVDQHWDAPPTHGPFYFVGALVPRVVWPEKPRVPDGGGYARQYCNIPYAMPAHSSSVTLLGEPLIMAGPVGLLVAGLVALLMLDRTGAVMLRGGVRAAWLGAVAPWLIDFDQHFTMYVANAVKFALVLAPLALGLGGLAQWRLRKQSKPCPEGSGTRK